MSAKNINQFLDYFNAFFAEKIKDHTHQNRLQEAILYAALGAGKRTRPLLCFIFAQMISPKMDETQITHILYGASAIEAIHCYSLVHDDLPAMDNDDLRRNMPTTHKKYCEATAILVGDNLQTLAFEFLTSPDFTCTDTLKTSLVRCLAAASGGKGMINGQFLDMNLETSFDPQNIDHINQMHQQKTGALIQASCVIGGQISGLTNTNHLDEIAQIGALIGRIFQIQDDILDVTQSTQTLGKTAGKDIEHNKPTIVSLIGLKDAQEHLQELFKTLKQQINQMPYNTDLLHQFIDQIAQRQS